jgi:hypothetical protein
MNRRVLARDLAMLASGLLLAAVLLTGCSTSGLLEPADAAPPDPLDVSNIPNAVPRPERHCQPMLK